MSTTTYTVTGGKATATQIVWAGSGPHLITNMDLVNSVFIGDVNTIRPQDGDGIYPLAPNLSVSVDGEADKFAVTSPGQTVIVGSILGGMANFLGLTVANGSLAIPSVRSPNFVTGVSGWTINKDGSAQFNNVTIRGTLTGPDYIIDSTGAFYYEGTPALGNLSCSDVPGTVTILDPKGNTALPGVTSYFNSAGSPQNACQSFGGGVNLYTWSGAAWVIRVATGVDFATGLYLVTAINNMQLSGDLQVIGSINSISGTQSDPSIITTDNWTTVTSFSANFAAGGPAPQYALEPIGVGGKAQIHLRGQVLLTGATAADAPMFAIPFVFLRNQDFVTANNLAGYAAGNRVVRVATSGNIRCEPTGVNTNFVLLDGIIAPMS